MNSKALCFLASLLMAFLLQGAIGAPGVRLRRSSDDISESGPLETLMWKGSADDEPELNGVRLKRSPYGVRLRRSSDDISESGPLSTLMWKRSANEVSESSPLGTFMWKMSAEGNSPFRA